MNKNILFPFEINQDNTYAYACAMQLAKQMKTQLILFTTISDVQEEEKLDAVYLHLLGLNGFYQTHFNQWQNKFKVPIKKIIKSGNLKEALQQFIKNEEVELVLFQKQTALA